MKMIPAPSYVVSNGDTVNSAAMGRMTAPDSRNGEYFHRHNAIWVNKATQAIKAVGANQASTYLKKIFDENCMQALKEKNRSLWHLADCFTEQGEIIDSGMNNRLAFFRANFLNGTFGLCVAQPDSESAIVHKEIVQEKLTALTENGAKEWASADDAHTMLDLIDLYDKAAMPFSALDYPRSSRKRLVDDLRTRLARLFPVMEIIT